LVILEVWEGEKGKFKICCSEGNRTRVSCMKCKSADHYTFQILL
jgi:hypothetical protein